MATYDSPAASTAAASTRLVVGIFASVIDTAALVSSCAAPTILWEVVSSTTTITGAGAGTRRVEAVVSATVVLNGTIIGSASYRVSGLSTTQVISGIQFLQKYWDGWIFNLNTKAPSFYENFKFNSFARIGDKYYGCNDAGIYLLDGDLDDTLPINAVITTGTSDLTTDKYDGATTKTVPYVYITARSPEPMLLTCNVEGNSGTYQFRAGKTVVAASRADVGKGIIGTFWQFELKNQNGADFDIKSLIAAPVSRSRRF